MHLNINIIIIAGLVLFIIFIYYLLFHNKYDCECDLIEKNTNVKSNNIIYISNCSIRNEKLQIDRYLVFTNKEDCKKYCDGKYLEGKFIGTNFKNLSLIPNNTELHIISNYDNNNNIISTYATDASFDNNGNYDNVDLTFLHDNAAHIYLKHGILKTGK